MREYDFSTVITHSEKNGVRVSHLPLIFQNEGGDHGTLVGHMAKGNTHWKEFGSQSEVLCIFHGPHGYISPTWYKHGPEVPTWNYAVVHAYGYPQLVQEEDELYDLVNFTIQHYEPELLDVQSECHLSEEVIRSQLKGIVGFKLPIHRLIGKYKLGQNRAKEDQEGLVSGLLQQDTGSSSFQLGKFIKEYQARKE